MLMLPMKSATPEFTVQSPMYKAGKEVSKVQVTVVRNVTAEMRSQHKTKKYIFPTHPQV